MISKYATEFGLFIFNVFSILQNTRTVHYKYYTVCGILEDDILQSKLVDNKNVSINIKLDENF